MGSDVTQIAATWAPIASAVAAVITLGVVIVYTALTHKMVTQAQLAREEDTRPYVTVRVVLSLDDVVCLVVKNHGRSAARDIDFVVRPPLPLTGNGPVRGLAHAIESRALPDLGPDEQLAYWWMGLREWPSAPLPRYTVLLRYAGGGRKEKWPTERFDIDLDKLDGVLRMTQDPLQGINAGINKVADHVAAMGKAATGLKPRA